MMQRRHPHFLWLVVKMCKNFDFLHSITIKVAVEWVKNHFF